MERLKVVILLYFSIYLLVLSQEKLIKLPAPSFKSNVSVEQALKNRRSVRKYKNSSLTLKEISQILWATDGKNAPWGGRTSPSAGATYPIEIYVLAGNVKGLNPGFYHYEVNNHSLLLIKKQDLRREVSKAAFNQPWVEKAPAVIVICAVFERTTQRYGERGKRYVYMEAGHCGQNLHLQCETLGLGTVMVGAFDDKSVKEILGIKEDVLYLCPVGRK